MNIKLNLLGLALVLTPTQLALGDTLNSRITDVMLYGQGAVVTRTAPLPSPEGSFVVEGLPPGLDPASVRVRCSGGEVVGVETRRHFRELAGGERLEALRAARTKAQADLDAARDQRRVRERLVGYYERLLDQERAAFERDLAAGTADLQRWRAGIDFFRTQLSEARAADRAALAAVQLAELALEAASAELSGATTLGGVTTWDVHVDVVGRAGMAALEVEYFVGDAGWVPVYDLRAAADLATAELVYRAKVWQTTGEDWPEVPIQLSTARPELGTRGPEPSVVWVGLFDPSSIVASAPSADWALGAGLKDLGYVEDYETGAPAEKAWAPTFAAAESSGLSVRFRLPRRETVESRDLPTTLLVGRAELELDVEHYAAPSVSERVWLRGRAVNSSPWELLAGEAAAYVGNDYVGRTRLAEVHVGEEFDLPLGPDGGLAVVRTKIEDLEEGPAFLRSKATEIEAWRIELSNYGALGTAPDGSVEVIVQEVLPRSTDGRLRVSLDEARPAVSTAERFAAEREESGILTWVLRVPADGSAELVWSREVAWPKDLEVVEQ